MSVIHRLSARPVWLLVAAACSLLLPPLPAAAQAEAASAQALATAIRYDIPAQSLEEALIEFGRQSKQELFYSDTDVAGKTSNAVSGNMSRTEAMAALLAGSGLEFEATPSGGMMIGDRVTLDAQRKTVPADGAAIPLDSAAPTETQIGAAAADSAASTVATVETTRRDGIEEIIVTGQKKEERIQDVPIAISAFSMEDLDSQKIEGGFDLLRAIPNVTFSKNNFTGYNFQIRGIGTKAISAATDPGVSVHFNGNPLLRNRLFEQEYFDIERVEVLRGPQGTLYGRNATGGVINVIANKAKQGIVEGEIKVEAGNFEAKRTRGALNVPLGESFAMRMAGSWTQREGYGINLTTGNDVDARDLWSGRLSLGWQPSDRIRADLTWEHFKENDSRARTGKQLCHKDPGLSEVGGVEVPYDALLGNNSNGGGMYRAALSQGCLPTSLYAAESLQAPNGLSLPFVLSTALLQDTFAGVPPGGTRLEGLIKPYDPYAGVVQSPNLRALESVIDPHYEAEADVVTFEFQADATDHLSTTYLASYNRDSVYSFQDYTRFASNPVFNDTSEWLLLPGLPYPSFLQPFSPGGIYEDPQLGPSNTLMGMDISRGESTQFSQELRVQSDFDGPINFSAGANYLRFKVTDDYYVMFNMLTLAARMANQGMADNFECRKAAPQCIYIDPNPIDQIDGDGHNYFRSKNPYQLTSRSVFGELYVEPADKVKLTAGLRYTDDRKVFTPHPSQTLLMGAFGGRNRGLPADPDIVQRWNEITGRIGVDWKPELGFTDDTMVYAFYSRGYKGGGANPPGVGGFLGELSRAFGANYAQTFEPEYVDAIELGAKNTLLSGSLMLNAAAFHYDYQGYQVSKIVDRTAVNENFDARVWGLELESLWQPTAQLRMNATLGFLQTKLKDGSESIDLMNRTQGNPDWTVVRPTVFETSNCIVPTEWVAEFLRRNEVYRAPYALTTACGGGFLDDGNVNSRPDLIAKYGGLTWDPRDAPNGGAGIAANVSGKELPNSPHWTFSVGAQYTWALPGVLSSWEVTARSDYYRQSATYARVYNTEYDRLQAWDNTNVSLVLAQPRNGFTVELYAKNVFDKMPITDAFLNSDDTGLTTNIFTLDPRLIGLSVRKTF
jgi:iron complex outermembrane receptor protein